MTADLPARLRAIADQPAGLPFPPAILHEAADEMDRLHGTDGLPQCGYGWTDGWGRHRCRARGSHRHHVCACDATEWQP